MTPTSIVLQRKLMLSHFDDHVVPVTFRGHSDFDVVATLDVPLSYQLK